MKTIFLGPLRGREFGYVLAHTVRKLALCAVSFQMVRAYLPFVIFFEPSQA